MDEILAKIGQRAFLIDVNCRASAVFPTKVMFDMHVRVLEGGKDGTIEPIGETQAKRLGGILGNVAPSLNRA